MVKEKFIVGDFIDGSAIVYKKQDMRLIKGLMFDNGSVKFFDVLHFGNFSDGLALIDTGRKIGFINRLGEYVLPPIYDFADDFSEDRTFVQMNESTILIDRKGSIIRDFDKIYITGRFNESFAQVGELTEGIEHIKISYLYKNGSLFVSSDEPREIINPVKIIDEEDDLSNHLVRFSKGGLFGYRNVFYEEKIEPVFDYAGKFSEGLAKITIGKRCGFIDKNGDVRISIEFDFVNSFSEGRASVDYKGKMGCINKEGDPVIPFEYNWLGHYKNGLIEFCKNGKWGLMDKYAEIIVPPVYDGIGNFVDGICEVVQNNHRGVRDRKGNEIFSDFIEGSEYHLLN